MVWRLLHANKVNPYWAEIEHYHNCSRKRLYAFLQEHGSRRSNIMLASAIACAWR
jgi:hypothetical protein